MPSWKSVQSRRKHKQKTKLALLVLGLIVLLLILSQVVNLSRTLLSPWKIGSTQKNYSWDGQFNINLIFRSKGIALVSYNPTDQKITVVDIPDETYLTSSHSFGDWQIRSLFDLGENQQGLGGDKLLKDTLTDFLGQPIDGFLDFSGSYKSKSAKEIVDIIRSSPSGPVNILSNLKTDLTLWELLRLKFALGEVRFDKLTEIDLQRAGVLEKKQLLDGTEVLIADLNILDTTLTFLSDPKIKNEHKTIALFNGADKALFAQKWARLIANMGGEVIILSNAQTKLDKTIVLGEKSDTLKRLQQIFNFHCSEQDCDKIQKTDLDIAESRGQINIKLALDLIN